MKLQEHEKKLEIIFKKYKYGKGNHQMYCLILNLI